MILNILVFVFIYVVEVQGLEEETEVAEARGKAKYALLTHLAILITAKVGLAKLVLAIAFVLAAIKAMVVMAWTLAISKYAPDVYKSRPDPHTNAPINTFMDIWLIHFFYVAATKLFVLKIVYGIIFYVLVTKAWYFVLWLAHYLKDKKHHEYVEYDYIPYYHDHHDHHDHHDDHHDHDDSGTYGSYGSYSNQAYSAYQKPSYGYKPKIYDADGSYSIKGA